MAWLVMQVADVILNNIVAPDWVFHVLLLFLAIGFPFSVFFAWAFELTPDGLKREHEVDRSQSITHEISKKLNLIITGVLATLDDLAGKRIATSYDGVVERWLAAFGADGSVDDTLRVGDRSSESAGPDSCTSVTLGAGSLTTTWTCMTYFTKS